MSEGGEDMNATKPVQFRQDQFGRCPMCGRCYEVNVERKWAMFVCHDHKVKWPAGYLGWNGQYETEEDWARNRAVLSTYREVRPDRTPQADFEPN